MPVRLHGKTVNFHSFWCSFYSLNKLLLMTMKIGPPSPSPCSLPGNKSDLSSSQPCRKEIIKIWPWCHFAVWTHSCLINPVHSFKSKFFSLRRGDCTSETRPWKGLTSAKHLRLLYFHSQGFLLEAERCFRSSLSPSRVLVAAWEDCTVTNSSNNLMWLPVELNEGGWRADHLFQLILCSRHCVLLRHSLWAFKTWGMYSFT